MHDLNIACKTNELQIFCHNSSRIVCLENAPTSTDCKPLDCNQLQEWCTFWKKSLKIAYTLIGWTNITTPMSTSIITIMKHLNPHDVLFGLQLDVIFNSDLEKELYMKQIQG